MTERAKATYKLIYENSFVNHRKTTQREIYENVRGYEWNESETAHDHCSAIWSDIAEINESDDADQVIISKNFEYWIGTQEETEKYLKGLWKALAPRLHRYWYYVKKIKLNGNIKLLEEDDFYKCFVKYESEIDQDR